METLSIGASRHDPSMAILDKIIISRDDHADALLSLNSIPGVAETVILATGNRVEIYIHADHVFNVGNDVLDWLAVRSGMERWEVERHVSVRDAEATARHLFAIACGLESMALGEDQIVRQLRAAMRTAETAGTIGARLSSLFQSALWCSHVVGDEPKIGDVCPTDSARSLAAVEAEMFLFRERAAEIDPLIAALGNHLSDVVTTELSLRTMFDLS